ncbi:MAG: hypothetical protein HRO68_01035 [Nitrosopumilus sp.]|nr:hypothetical protein [Nitrosopumilus sp.]
MKIRKVRNCIVCNVETVRVLTTSNRKTCCNKCSRIYCDREEILERKRKYQREHSKKPEIKQHRKIYFKKYRQTPKSKQYRKEYMSKYTKTDEFREHRKIRRKISDKIRLNKPEVKRYMKQYRKEYRQRCKVRDYLVNSLKQYLKTLELKNDENYTIKKLHSFKEIIQVLT